MFALQQASVFVVLGKRVITVIADKGIEYQGMKLARTIGLFDEACAKLKAKSDEIKLVMFGSDEQIVKYYQNYGQSIDQSYSAAWEMLNEINTVKTKKKEAQEKKANTKAKAKTAKFDKVADIVDMHGEVLAEKLYNMNKKEGAGHNRNSP